MHNDIKKVPFFRFWCQRVIPLVYDSSLSYYELLCKVVDYLNNVIKDTNALIEDNTQLHKDFDTFKTQVITANSQLKAWINDYFKNLDVQDEINNKLDELVADGYFDTIVNNYLSLHTVNIHHFVVNDMINDVSLKKGYFVTTEGYNFKNDGGGCNWYITDEIISDNEGVSLNNGLFAKRLLYSIMPVECFGAYGNGLIDDSESIKQALISKVKITFRSNHNYKVAKQIIIPFNLPILINGNNANIIIDDSNIRAEGNITDGYGVFIFNGDTFINDLNVDYNSHQLSHTICPLRVNNGDVHIWENVNIHSYEDENSHTHSNVVWFNFTEKTNGIKYGCDRIVMKNCKLINDTTAHSTGCGALWITGLSILNNRNVGDGINSIEMNSCTFKTSVAGDTINIWCGADNSGSNLYKKYTTAKIKNIIFNSCIIMGSNYSTEIDPSHNPRGSGMIQLGNSRIIDDVEQTIAGFNACVYENVTFNDSQFILLDYWGQEIIATTSSETTFNFNNCYFKNNSPQSKALTMCIFNNHSLKNELGKEIITRNCHLFFSNCVFENEFKSISNGRTVLKNAECDLNFNSCTINADSFYPETNSNFYNCNITTTGTSGVRDRRSTGTINEFKNVANFYNCYINSSLYVYHNNNIINCYINSDLYVYANSEAESYQTVSICNNNVKGEISLHSYDRFGNTNIYDTKGIGTIIINNVCSDLTFDGNRYTLPQTLDILYDALKYPRYNVANNSILELYNASIKQRETINFLDREAQSLGQRFYPYSTQSNPIQLNVSNDEYGVSISVQNEMFGGFYSDRQQPMRVRNATNVSYRNLYTMVDTDFKEMVTRLNLSVDYNLTTSTFANIKYGTKNIEIEIADKAEIESYFNQHKEDLPTDNIEGSQFKNKKYIPLIIQARPMDSETPAQTAYINVYCTDIA